MAATLLGLGACSTAPKLPPQPEAQAALVSGSNAFAENLYGELSHEPGNLFFSPVSISTAFGLLYPGAEGNTAAEIASVMGYTLEESADFAGAMGELHAELETDDETAKLRIANSAWVRTGEKLSADYLTAIQEKMAAEIRSIDFSRAEAARKTINDWVLDYTNDRIGNLIPAEFIDPDLTNLVLVNAVWFKADWAQPFNAARTRKGEFLGRDGRKVPALYMNSLPRLRHHDSSRFHAVELDYSGDEFALAILLPKAPEDLPELEADLATGRIGRALDALASAEPVLVDLKIPKVTASASYQLAAPLQALGMRQVFTRGAELGGLFSSEHPYAVSNVVHKTFLEINEKGTEAAAATAIGVTISSARRLPHDPITFHATHPFLVILRHKPTGAILFIGRIEDPGIPPELAPSDDSP
ncbi:serpin family protein [Hyphomonas sp.]|uniref:serpin family protein n=1 Tax=Hyphomonas sp. TaxID=87 RepID=UPI001DF252C1|nr:serpin family protein [Hyphomonas sp.]MBU3921917.1 serpin family protein [Alphaproteobacteria bacterium]MBU4063702.1 serpin family protein [Alphaproteobacteria bacterium]MBU4164337.1 serpin family protein [Alphaproteobacteria bacterium]